MKAGSGSRTVTVYEMRFALPSIGVQSVENARGPVLTSFPGATMQDLQVIQRTMSCISIEKYSVRYVM